MKTNHIIHTLLLLTLLAVCFLMTACVERNLYDEDYYTLLMASSGDDDVIAEPTYAEQDVFYLSETELVFPSRGGIDMIHVVSSRPWTIFGDVTWVTLSTYYGTGDASIEVSVEANPSEEPRAEMLIFSSGGVTREVIIAQEGQYSTR